MHNCFINEKVYRTIILVYIATAFWLSYFTPLTPSEANIFYSHENYITNLIVKFASSFTDNKFIIRVPFLILSILSLILYSQIVKRYFDSEQYRYLSIVLFILTPGVLVSFIIVNYATVAIFLILLFIYAEQRKNIILEIIALVLLLGTNTAQFAVYIGVLFYAYRKKDWLLFIVSFLLLIFSVILAKYPIDGIPKGHLLQLFGIYGTVLSPFYFIFLLYALYRVGVKGKRDILWHIALSALFLSIILSIRQKIIVTDFTPYLVIAAPLAVEVYKNSVSIRLKLFKRNYIRLCKIIFTVLLLETLLIVFNYPIYIISDKKLQIVNKNIYKIEKLANKLKKSNINCLKDIKHREINLYKYYGVTLCK